jgi:ATP-dependent Clp protease ATP-binding subunit ClpC
MHGSVRLRAAMPTYDTLNPSLSSKGLSRALNQAAEIMRTLGKQVLTPEVLLLAFLRSPDSTAHRMLERFADTRGFKLADLDAAVLKQAQTREGRDVDFSFVADSGVRVPMSDEMLAVLDEGKTIAQALDEVWVGSEHALGAMSQAGVSTAGLLQSHGVTPQAMTEVLADQALARRETTNDWVALAKSGDVHPVVYREGLLRDLLSMLSLARERHVVLVGPAGVGKRTLVYSLALLIAEGKGPAGIKSVVEISEQALLDNALGAVQAGLRRASGGILFVPNIHRFVGGAKGDLPAQVGALLQRAMLSDEVIVVGTTTETELTRVQSGGVFAEHSHVLRVPPARPDEAVTMLVTLKAGIERDYGLTLADDVLKTAVTLAGQYLTTQPLPGAAVQLLHRACAVVRMSTQSDLAFKPDVKADTQLDAEDVMLAASMMTGIPVAKLGQDERSKYASMVEQLQQRVIGQDEAVLALSRAVKSARVGLKDPKRPIGSFFFLGPSGVGKTELAKALAEFMFGTEDALLALDMSEYMHDDAVNRLIGAPPGYVGYEAGGQLTESMLRSPYAVVLFDEAEKAHPRVFDLLLQVMEEGRMTDGQGRVARFNDAVIIFTSNVGAQFLVDPALSREQSRDLALETMKQTFRPEFLNRLDEIIFFNPLGTAELQKIIRLLLKKEKTLAAQSGIALDVTDAACDWLIAQNDHPEWGARPLRRIIQRYLREPLADWLLAQERTPGTAIRVDLRDGKLTFE